MDAMTKEQELEHAKGRVHHLERQCLKQQDHIQQLEQLCRDMWKCIDYFVVVSAAEEFPPRMKELGLFDD